MRVSTAISTASEERAAFGWVDAVVLLAIFGLLWSVLHFGRGMLVHFDESQMPQLSTNLSRYSVLRGTHRAAHVDRLRVFALVHADCWLCGGKEPDGASIHSPALDVLQSVPVLGFLSATVAGFMALFPGSLLGVECASIFAIFTGQVWNMTFGFYHSLVSIPSDMQEAASTYGLNRWQRFTTVEVPASMHSLIWNSMMSFGGGWFFVAQSEAISVMNKDIKLPGLGSFMATAVDRGDNQAAMWAIIAMLVVILGTDQLVWRPLLAWADNFKIELTESGAPPSSWVYSLLRRSYLFPWLDVTVWQPFSDWLRNYHVSNSGASGTAGEREESPALDDCAARSSDCLCHLGQLAGHSRRDRRGGCRMAPCPTRGIRTYCLAGRPHDVSRSRDDRSRDADLDAYRSPYRVSSEGGALRPAACPDRCVLPGEHDLSVRRRVLRRASVFP